MRSIIPDGAFVHDSVLKRVAAVEGYRPINLPARYETVPMPEPPNEAV